MVDASLTGNLVNTATVSSTTPDPNLSNNTATVTSVVTSSADMQITKTCMTSPVIAGLPVLYALTVHNNGPSTAVGVMILDNVPVEILLPQYALSLSGPWLPWTGSYPVGTLLSGGGMTIYIEGTLNASASGSITNVATVTSTTPDPDLTNNTATSIVSVSMLADMAITKTCNTSPVIAGQQIVYTLGVVNYGPSDAQNVTINDVVPASITNVQYSTNGGSTWLAWSGSYNAGTVAAFQTFSLLIQGTVISNPTGSITNTATVSSTTSDPNLSNNTSTVVVDINRPPVTFNEHAYICMNGTITGNVLLNGDYDPDGTAITVNPVPVVNAAHGTFTVLSNGDYIYTPTPGFTGSDMAVMSVCDNGIPLPSQCTNDTIFLNVVTVVTADAGPDQSIPVGTSTRLSGTATGGSGIFAFEWQPATLLLGYTTESPETVILIGPVTFWFTVTDLLTGCKATDSVRITINSQNLPPVAFDDYDTTGVNIPINITILKNDYDPDGKIVSVTLCGGPYNGLVTLNSDSTITYTPKAGFTGIDSLCYFICDNGVPVLCDTATVYILVSGNSHDKRFIIYNVITPNGDGDNDRWIIDGIEEFPNNSVVIFNRWGDKINQFEHYDNKTVVWDGTNLKGRLVPDGTYYYILTIKDYGSRNKDGNNWNGWIFVRKGSE